MSALVIALIGMTLLFLSLIFFYGLLSLITAVIKDRPTPKRAQAEVRTSQGERGIRPEEVLRAAAVAVALARAEAEGGPGLAMRHGPSETTVESPISPWWSLHHQRTLATNPNARRIR
jgi:hypothetical protein